MLDLVITGGQTGSDQAGWRAARKFQIPRAGIMPQGFLTEDGPRPEFAREHGAIEADEASYPIHTRQNLALCGEKKGVAVVFDGSEVGTSRGTKCITKALVDLQTRRKPFPHLVIVRLAWYSYTGFWDVASGSLQSHELGHLILDHNACCLLVAGNRESGAMGIGTFVEKYLGTLFYSLGHRAN